MVRLAGALTGAEANQVADRLAARASRAQVLQMLSPTRRGELRPLLDATVDVAPEELVRALRCIAVAKADRPRIGLIWTAPRDLVSGGGLTSALHHLVDDARGSIVCATFNFQRSSAQWEALREASARPDLDVRVYVDQSAADARPRPGTPTTREVADELRGATVLRSRSLARSPHTHPRQVLRRRPTNPRRHERELQQGRRATQRRAGAARRRRRARGLRRPTDAQPGAARLRGRPPELTSAPTFCCGDVGCGR